MGFHLRKSINLGGIRLNLSNSGIGFSTGIKGLRVGVDGKGKAYIGGGKGILRYRKTLGNLTQEDREKFENTFSLKPLGVLLQIVFILILPVAIFFYFVFSILLVQINGFLMLAAWGLGIYLIVLFCKKYLKIFTNPIELKRAEIALLKYNQGNYKEALEDCVYIADKINDNLFFSFNYNFTKLITNIRYDCYIGLNEYENALNYIETSQARTFLSYRERKVTCLYKLKKFKELIFFMQTEYSEEEKNEHPRFYALLGDVFLSSGQKEAALEALLQGPVKKRSMNDEMCAFRYQLGLCYEANNDKKNALKQYQKIYSYDINYEDVADRISNLEN